MLNYLYLAIFLTILLNLNHFDSYRVELKNTLLFDYNNRLIWQEETYSSELNWENANKYCKNLSLFGYENWRLPSVLELITLNKVAILDKKRVDYWGKESIGSYAFGYNYNLELISFDSKDDIDFVRCVQGF